jgi:hypothetical protein
MVKYQEVIGDASHSLTSTTQPTNQQEQVRNRASRMLVVSEGLARASYSGRVVRWRAVAVAVWFAAWLAALALLLLRMFRLVVVVVVSSRL